MAFRIIKEAPEDYEYYLTHRDAYRKMVDTANKRWKNIEKQGLESRAVDNALDANPEKYFRVGDLRGEDGISELTRLRDFLADSTSTVRGAKYYQTTVIDTEEFRNKYGRSWETRNGVRYNNYKERFEADYGEEFTKRVYSNYRRLEKDFNELLQAGVLGEGYGSDELITLMFKLAVEGEDQGFNMVLQSGPRAGELRDETEAPEFKAANMLKYFRKNKIEMDEKIFDKNVVRADRILMERKRWYDDTVARRFEDFWF